MIYAQSVQLGTPLGGDAAVKTLQTELIKLYNASGKDPDFAGVQATGDVDFFMVWSLISVVRKGLASLPGMSDVINLIDTVAGIGPGSFRDKVWAAYSTNLGGATSYINDLIKGRASDLTTAVKAAVQALAKAPTAPPPTTTVIPTRVKPADISTILPHVPGVYPAGSFAVRDPATNRYRILVPVR